MTGNVQALYRLHVRVRENEQYLDKPALTFLFSGNTIKYKKRGIKGDAPFTAVIIGLHEVSKFYFEKLFISIFVYYCGNRAKALGAYPRAPIFVYEFI